MYIVKNLKDYDLSLKQRIFAGYIKDNVDSFVCYEKITNRTALRNYFAPDNETYLSFNNITACAVCAFRPEYRPFFGRGRLPRGNAAQRHHVQHRYQQ